MTRSEPELRTAFGDALGNALRRSLRSDGPLGVLFSGGLDSSLLAWEVRHRPETTLWTVGAEGSPDLASAESAARILGLPWHGVRLNVSDIPPVLGRFAAELEGASGPAFEVAVAFALAVQGAEAPVLLTGQGADELFLGYAHFRGLQGSALRERADADLAQLVEREWPRSERVAERAGRTLVAPFLDPEVIRIARSIPLSDRAPDGLTKGWLRAWAIARGLPSAIALRPKRALQYGSRVHRLLRGVSPAVRSL